MAGEKILIIEDDPTLSRVLRDNCAHEGYQTECAADGKLGLEMALKNRASLILLDIMLPKINGYELCRLLREAGLETPIIMLTAKGQEADIVLGLNAGADDYVTKPFSIGELLARINAALRRQKSAQPQSITFGDFTLDLASRRMTRAGEEVILTPKEFDVLALLAQHPGRAFTRDTILSQVWGYSVFVTARSVDRCITTLRGKIEADPARPRHITTIRTVGYRFESE